MAVPPCQAGVAAFLEGFAGAPPVETHITCVFRGQDTVWKLKKAVRLGFLDFTALADRRHFLERELTLNAAAAPGLYRDVVPVTRTEDGFALDGTGEVADWVLRMALVPEQDFLDAMASARRLDAALLVAVADAVVALRRTQAGLPSSGPRPREHERIQKVVEGNATAAKAAGLPQAEVAAWQADAVSMLARTGPLLDARAGLVRRCHGDLHLGNMLLWQGKPVPFDALEFDEELATIDPGYDLAFLLMDLDVSVARAAANIVLNRYVSATGDTGLLALLPLFLSVRAMVRAHVAAARGQDGMPLLQAARRYLRPDPAVVVAVGGLQGSGKSTLARALAPSLGAAPGALVLRSDEVRKRLAGVEPDQRLPPDAYTPEARRQTEAAMLDAMKAVVAGGHSVVLDATFIDPAARATAQQAAAAPFLGVWLDAELPWLEARVARRRDDASDATVAVLRAAAAHARPPAGWLVLDAAADGLEQQVQRALSML